MMTFWTVWSNQFYNFWRVSTCTYNLESRSINAIIQYWTSKAILFIIRFCYRQPWRRPFSLSPIALYRTVLVKVQLKIINLWKALSMVVEPADVPRRSIWKRISTNTCTAPCPSRMGWRITRRLRQILSGPACTQTEPAVFFRMVKTTTRVTVGWLHLGGPSLIQWWISTRVSIMLFSDAK